MDRRRRPRPAVPQPGRPPRRRGSRSNASAPGSAPTATGKPTATTVSASGTTDRPRRASCAACLPPTPARRGASTRRPSPHRTVALGVRNDQMTCTVVVPCFDEAPRFDADAFAAARRRRRRPSARRRRLDRLHARAARLVRRVGAGGHDRGDPPRTQPRQGGSGPRRHAGRGRRRRLDRRLLRRRFRDPGHGARAVAGRDHEGPPARRCARQPCGADGALDRAQGDAPLPRTALRHRRQPGARRRRVRHAVRRQAVPRQRHAPRGDRRPVPRTMVVRRRVARPPSASRPRRDADRRRPDRRGAAHRMARRRRLQAAHPARGTLADCAGWCAPAGVRREKVRRVASGGAAAAGR